LPEARAEIDDPRVRRCRGFHLVAIGAGACDHQREVRDSATNLRGSLQQKTNALAAVDTSDIDADRPTADAELRAQPVEAIVIDLLHGPTHLRRVDGVVEDCNPVCREPVVLQDASRLLGVTEPPVASGHPNPLPALGYSFRRLGMEIPPMTPQRKLFA